MIQIYNYHVVIHESGPIENLFYKSENRFKIKQLLIHLWINEDVWIKKKQLEIGTCLKAIQVHNFTGCGAHDASLYDVQKMLVSPKTNV